MQLYERDYTKLTTEEEAQWQSLQHQEVVQSGTLHFKTSLFRNYPKAVRHFISLFPNNYLDIVELSDETWLNRQLDQFRYLIDSDDATERNILDFIRQHRAYFIVASILDQYFHFGHHDAYLFREFQLGNSFQADFLLVGKGSDGWHFVFVEFEAPAGNITLENDDFGSALRKGLSQVEKWDQWIEARYGSLAETFDKRRRCDSCLPREFVTLDKSRIHYVLVAGRRRDFSDSTYRQRRKKQKENSELILHYDNVIDAAQNVIGKATY
jgi:hypothetical protein